MKTNYLFASFVVLFISLTSFKNSNMVKVQELQVIEGVFDGHEDYGYNFIVNKEGEDHTMTFQKVDDEVLNTFNLNIPEHLGAKFKITYTNKIVVTKDEDGYEDENEINTIKKLEKL